jgi:hypothetical protein
MINYRYEVYNYSTIDELRDILSLTNIKKVVSNSSPTIGKLGYVILEVWVDG